jgi:3-dehydroquinate synthase
MKIIKLKLKNRSYKIIIGNNIIKRLAGFLSRLDIGRDAYIITPPVIRKKYGDVLKRPLKKGGFSVRFKVVPGLESSKSLKYVSSILQDLACYDKKRRVFIIALAGGVIGDLAGFVASIYKRGIPYIQVPTTLLAQVDSSIGGKTAVDLAQGKNLVGAFYQPKLVYSDIKLLKTLSDRQLRSGLAEVIKYGVIKDKNLFSYLEKNYKDILNQKPAALEHIIRRSSEIKARIVEVDEREEKGIRTVLNFGHTVGHAIEAAAGFKLYNHGESIALGMLAAVDISRRLKLIDDAVGQRIEGLIKDAGLPTRISRISLNAIINAHYRDKKFIGARNRFVLTGGLGKTKIVENIPLKIIREAIGRRIFR